MKKIALIIPYFTSGGGNFPAYFQFFLNSCADNPTIDWLIYTDDAFLFETPENVYVHKCSFEWFRNRLQGLFDFEITLDKPYKLCDYRPAYGQALEEDLRSYDYWGYCDCDVIFGDIRKFVQKALSEDYDKLFTRGHLSIYRNDKTVNEFYRKTNRYKIVYSNPQPFAFDEWSGISQMYQSFGRPYYDELVYDDIKTQWDGFHLTKAYRGAYHEKNDISQIDKFKAMRYIYYEHKDGQLIRKCIMHRRTFSEEVLYVHFQKRPLSPFSLEVGLDCRNYIVLPNKVLPYRSISYEDMRNELQRSETIRNFFLEQKQKLYSIYLRHIKPKVKPDLTLMY